MEAIEVPHAEWNMTLRDAGCTDVYLSLGYHRASAYLEPGQAEPVLLMFPPEIGGGYFLPLLLRRMPHGHYLDATSTYGYGGPCATGQPDLGLTRRLLDRWAAERNVVASVVRTHPALANNALLPAGATIVSLGSTVEWAIPQSPMSRFNLMANLHTNHRRSARKADRSGVEVRVKTSPANLGEFAELYRTTMVRQGASDFYHFSDSYWDGLTQQIGESLLLVEAWLDGQLVAAVLCLVSGDCLHYHLGATADEGRRCGASTRCFVEAAVWAQTEGIRHFHLGGGVGGEESLLRTFKRRFDPDGPEHPFRVGKLVHLTDVYREMTGGDSVEGYFPPWRR